MPKSFVSMEQNVCIVCATKFDTGALLLDKHFRDKFEPKTLTGIGACPEHQKLADDGYIALIGISNHNHGASLKPEDAERTGELAHMKKEVFFKMFNIPPLDPAKFPMVFIEPEVMVLLKEMTGGTDGSEERTTH